MSPRFLHVGTNSPHLSHRQLVVELADVRIIAFGVLNKPRGSTTVNSNARLFLHPSGVENLGSGGAPAGVTSDAADIASASAPVIGGCQAFYSLLIFFINRQAAMQEMSGRCTAIWHIHSLRGVTPIIRSILRVARTSVGSSQVISKKRACSG